jgi:hypothetical protein
MSGLHSELQALWIEVFGEPPSVNADAKLLSELLVRYLPPAPPYGQPERVEDGKGPAPEVGGSDGGDN